MNRGSGQVPGIGSYAAPQIRDLLDLDRADPIDGELDVEAKVHLDHHVETGKYPTRIYHRELTSAGGIAEVL